MRGRENRQRFEAVAAVEARTAAQTTPSADEAPLVATRNATIREAFARLPLNCQQLLSLLVHDPPLRYTEITARLGMRMGGLPPRRGCCLEKLSRLPAACRAHGIRRRAGGRGRA